MISVAMTEGPWTCEHDCGFTNLDFEVVAAHERCCSSQSASNNGASSTPTSKPSTQSPATVLSPVAQQALDAARSRRNATSVPASPAPARAVLSGTVSPVPASPSSPVSHSAPSVPEPPAPVTSGSVPAASTSSHVSHSAPSSASSAGICKTTSLSPSPSPADPSVVRIAELHRHNQFSGDDISTMMARSTNRGTAAQGSKRQGRRSATLGSSAPLVRNPPSRSRREDYEAGRQNRESFRLDACAAEDTGV